MSKPRRLSRRRARSRGYNLIEILIAVSIVALLSSMVGFASINISMKAKVQTAGADARTIRTAALSWAGSHGTGECPRRSMLVDDGILDEASHTSDPWKTPYRIICKEERISVSSAGPDRKFDSQDDIVAPPIAAARPVAEGD
jgi:general secretion pathway protein G